MRGYIIPMLKMILFAILGALSVAFLGLALVLVITKHEEPLFQLISLGVVGVLGIFSSLWMSGVRDGWGTISFIVITPIVVGIDKNLNPSFPIGVMAVTIVVCVIVFISKRFA